MNKECEVFAAKMQKTLDMTRHELTTIRAGRANPAVLDKLTVEYFGAPMAVNQVAAIAMATVVLILWSIRCVKNGGKKEATDKEGCYQVPGKLHQRRPILMQKHAVHGMRDSIPRKGPADETASNPALRRIDEYYRDGICYQRSGQRPDLGAAQKERKRK